MVKIKTDWDLVKILYDMVTSIDDPSNPDPGRWKYVVQPIHHLWRETPMVGETERVRLMNFASKLVRAGIDEDHEAMQELIAAGRDWLHPHKWAPPGEYDNPTIENIVEEVEAAPGHIPGILFPIDHSAMAGNFESIDGRVFISRSDQAGMFHSDVAAANFVACLIGKPWKKFFDEPPKPYFFPYFEITLAEAEEINRKFGVPTRGDN